MIFDSLHDDFSGPRLWPIGGKPGKNRRFADLIDLVDRIGGRYRCHFRKLPGIPEASGDNGLTNVQVESAEKLTRSIQMRWRHDGGASLAHRPENGEKFRRVPRTEGRNAGQLVCIVPQFAPALHLRHDAGTEWALCLKRILRRRILHDRGRSPTRVFPGLKIYLTV